MIVKLNNWCQLMRHILNFNNKSYNSLLIQCLWNENLILNFNNFKGK